MTENEYLTLQQDNIETALRHGRELLRISESLHGVANDANAEKTETDSSLGYMRDAFKYYDFNDSAVALSRETAVLNRFKQSLIDIKIANDRMLLEGGYRKEIDETIAGVFLSHTLCKIKIIDKNVLDTVVDALDKLETLKQELA